MNDLLKLIKRFEGCKLKAYYCPAGILTIGWGATGDIAVGEIWTQEQADKRLEQDAYKFFVGTKKLLPNASDRVIIACTDFAYNLGLGALKTSTLRRKILAGDIEQACVQLARWNKGGGRVLRGLVLRRQAEINYIKGV